MRGLLWPWECSHRNWGSQGPCATKPAQHSHVQKDFKNIIETTKTNFLIKQWQWIHFCCLFFPKSGRCTERLPCCKVLPLPGNLNIWEHFCSWRSVSGAVRDVLADPARFSAGVWRFRSLCGQCHVWQTWQQSCTFRTSNLTLCMVNDVSSLIPPDLYFVPKTVPDQVLMRWVSSLSSCWSLGESHFPCPQRGSCGKDWGS